MEQTPRAGVAGQQRQLGGSRSETTGRPHDSQPPTRRKAVLVVDDEPAFTIMLAEVFSRDNFVVETAADGEEALKKLEQRSYDVILCDVRMPRLNGPGFYRVIEQRAPALLSRVLFVTGAILSPETRAFLRQTDAPVLEKPFSLGEISKVVRHILRAQERR